MVKDDVEGLTNLPFGSFEDSAIERSIVARFRAIAGRYATRVAIDDGVTRLTYCEAWRITCHLARRIEIVVPLGRPVAIVLPNAALFPVAALACLAVGRPYVPIDLDYPAARNAEIMREAGVAAAITQPGLVAATELIPKSLPRIDASLCTPASDAAPLDLVDAKGPAIILFTSGSTGRPKGICNDQGALLLRIAQFTDACHIRAEDRFVLLSSPSTIAGVRDTFTALLNGATLRIAELRRIGIGGLQQVIRDERISVYYSVPAVLRSLLSGADAKPAVASLRVVRLGGDTIFEEDMALFRAMLPPTCSILVGFGSTEVPTVFQWFARPGMADRLCVPSGFPAPGVAFTLVGQDGAPVPAGEIGELVVRSRHIALGLWQQGLLSPGNFESDRLDPGVRILHTGDLFRIRPDGLAEHCGRKDRQVKIRGLRVDPGEVEAALRRCHGVADAAVIARREIGSEVALVAFVVAQPWAAPLRKKDLGRALSAWLPPQKCPAMIHVVDEIPRLPSFKPDLATLATLDLARRGAGDTPETGRVAPTASQIAPEVDYAVKRAWTGVCGARSFARDLPWEEAGGDSLKALELLLQIEETLGRRLSTDLLSVGMTPRGLCAAIEQAIGETPEDAAPHGVDDGRITVFVMPGILYDLALARFLHALRDRIRFVLIGYPDWREMIAAKADFDAIVTEAQRQILSQCGDGPIRLAGYSFGGFVAFTAAHRLVASGRRVTFLGLLDARRASPFEASLPATAAKSFQLIGKIREILKQRDVGLNLRRIFRTFLEFRAFGLLDAFARFYMSVAGRRARANAHAQLLDALRSYALRGWTPNALSVPTFFFRAKEYTTPHLPYDCGWEALCSQLSVVSIDGDHFSMMEPPHAERLCSSFLEALRAADTSVEPLDTDRVRRGAGQPAVGVIDS